MYFVLFLLGIIIWTVFSGLDGLVKNQKIQSEKRAVCPMGCAKEYKMAYDKYQDLLQRAENEGWDKVETDIWHSLKTYPAVAAVFRQRNLSGEKLASQWAQAYARIQVVKMGYTPYHYAPSPHCPKKLPTDDSYIYFGSMWNLNWWNASRYNQYKSFEQMSEQLVREMHT